MAILEGLNRDSGNGSPLSQKPDFMAEKSRHRHPESETEDETSISSWAPALGDYRLTVDLVGTMNRELGKLSSAVETLTEESKGLRSKVDRISHIMYAVAAVGTIGIGIIVWIVNKAIDYGLSTMKHP